MSDRPIEAKDDEPVGDETDEGDADTEDGDGDEPEDATDRFARFAWRAGEVTVAGPSDDQKAINQLVNDIKAIAPDFQL